MGRARRTNPSLARRSGWLARSVGLFLAWMSCIATVPRAGADPGLMPTSMRPARFEAFLVRAGASADQRVAALEAFAAYARGYQARAEELASTTGPGSPADRARRANPTPSREAELRSEARAVLRRWQSLAQKDAAFLTQLAELFDDEAAPEIEALALDRASEAWIEIGDGHILARSADLDLAELLPESELASLKADHRAAFGAALDDWRRRRVRLLADWAEAAVFEGAEVADQLARAAAAGADPDDFMVRRDAWIAAQEAIAAAGVAVARQNRRTVDQLASLLPGDAAMRLRAAWRRAQRDMPPVADGPLEAWIADARSRLASDRPDLVERFDLLARVHHDRLHRITVELAEAREVRDGSQAAHMRRYLLANAPDPIEAAEAAWRDALATATRDRRVAGDAARAALVGLLADLGPDAPSLPPLPERPEPATAAPREMRSISADADGNLSLSITNFDPLQLARRFGLGAAFGRTGLIPEPVTRTDVLAWAVRFDADRAAALEPVLDAVHDAYIEHWLEVRRNGSAGRAETLAAALLAPGPDGTFDLPRAADLDRVMAARRAAFDEFTAADETLFADLELVVDGTADARDRWLDDIRGERTRERLRQVLPRDLSTRFSWRGATYRPDEPRLDTLRLDLAVIVRTAFGEAVPPAAANVVQGWEDAVAGPLAAIVEVARRDQRAQIGRVVEALERDEDGRLLLADLPLGQRPTAIDAPEVDPAFETDAEWDRAARALAAVHRRHLESLRASLADEPDRLEAFEEAFRRADRPGRYLDASRADSAFRSALARPDLPESDRVRLEDAWTAYRAAWEAQTRRYVDAGDDLELARRMADERAALNEAALATVRSILGPLGPLSPVSPVAPSASIPAGG